MRTRGHGVSGNPAKELNMNTRKNNTVWWIIGIVVVVAAIWYFGFRSDANGATVPVDAQPAAADTATPGQAGAPAG